MKRHLTLLLSFFTVTLSLIAGGPKYLFLFIGDGMGAEQINAVQMYINAIQGTEQKLNMLQFPVKGVTKTSAANFFITDSAAAGTAIATGHKTNLGVLGLDPSLNRELETVAERCQTLGMKVGIITTVSADHATPAAFYAHQTSRSHYYEIARQLVESDFNFFGTGSLRYPAGKYDEKENIFDYAQQNGYKLINTQSEYTSFRPEASTEEKIWIISEKIAGDSAIPYSIDNTNTFDIDDITQTAIDFLYNESGFFLMIEAGKVDWACHANDAAAAIHDLLAFDRAIAHAVDFYRKYPEDTLIIVTGDHETGGLKTDFIGTNHISDIRLIQNQLISHKAFEIYSPFLEDLIYSEDKEWMDMIINTLILGDLVRLSPSYHREAILSEVFEAIERKAVDLYWIKNITERVSALVDGLRDGKRVLTVGDPFLLFNDRMNNFNFRQLEQRNIRLIYTPLSEYYLMFWKDHADFNGKNGDENFKRNISTLKEKIELISEIMGENSNIDDDYPRLKGLADEHIGYYSGMNGRYRYAKVHSDALLTDGIITVSSMYENTGIMLNILKNDKLLSKPVLNLTFDGNKNENDRMKIESFIYYI